LPRIEVEGAGAYDVEEGKRLVLAIEEDPGVDILHESVCDRKLDGGYRLKAVLSEHGNRLELMKGVAGA
jgi:hypothetical protein